MVATYLGMILTGLDPSTHRHNARQRCGARILACPELDTLLPARHKAAGVHGALSFMMTLGTFGVAAGPALVGALQDRLGDLRLAMIIISFAPTLLAICSSLIHIRTDQAMSY